MPKRKRKKEDGSKNKVKYKGVYKKGNKFYGTFMIDGMKHCSDTFNTPKEAAQAYDRAAIQAGRPTSKLNFLDQVPKNYKPKNNGLASTNMTGFKGVTKRGNRFEARIRIGGKSQNIGTFGTAKEAAEAYDQAALQAKFPRSELNFSDTPKQEVSRIKKRRIITYKNKTGFNGVSKKGKKFQAQIYFDGETKHLGLFTKPRDAAMAYDKKIRENNLPLTKLNFPDEHSEEPEVAVDGPENIIHQAKFDSEVELANFKFEEDPEVEM